MGNAFLFVTESTPMTLSLFLTCTAALFVYMTLGFLLALYLKKNSIVDVLYGLGVLLVTTVAYALAHVGTEGSWTVFLPLMFTAVWALRLSYRIFKKNYSKPEDARYAAWRTQWSARSRTYFLVRSFLQIFMLQGVVIFCIALPATLTAIYGSDLAVVQLVPVYAGISLWLVGFFFEAVGDYQLDAHIANPATKGTLMTTGLWAYTRHPNYFGEICMWVGIALISAAHMPSLLLILACFVSPGLIAYLLIFVSGIPMLEPLMAKKDGWAAYAATTPALVPIIGWK